MLTTDHVPERNTFRHTPLFASAGSADRTHMHECTATHDAHCNCRCAVTKRMGMVSISEKFDFTLHKNQYQPTTDTKKKTSLWNISRQHFGIYTWHVYTNKDKNVLTEAAIHKEEYAPEKMTKLFTRPQTATYSFGALAPRHMGVPGAPAVCIFPWSEVIFHSQK